MNAFAYTFTGLILLSTQLSVEASYLEFSRRDKTAEIAAVVEAAAKVLAAATDSELQKLRTDMDSCLKSRDHSFIESVFGEAAKEDNLRRMSDELALFRRLFRERRSLDDYFTKRSRADDINVILQGGKKLLTEMSEDQVKQSLAIDTKLDAQSPDAERKYLEIFINLAAKCGKIQRRREYSDDDAY